MERAFVFEVEGVLLNGRLDVFWRDGPRALVVVPWPVETSGSRPTGSENSPNVSVPPVCGGKSWSRSRSVAPDGVGRRRVVVAVVTAGRQDEAQREEHREGSPQRPTPTYRARGRGQFHSMPMLVPPTTAPWGSRHRRRILAESLS